jgi:hypothetical protein
LVVIAGGSDGGQCQLGGTEARLSNGRTTANVVVLLPSGTGGRTLVSQQLGRTTLCPVGLGSAFFRAQQSCSTTRCMAGHHKKPCRAKTVPSKMVKTISPASSTREARRRTASWDTPARDTLQALVPSARRR